MEPLDLTCHAPDMFLGKSVTLDGRTYRIGPNFRTGDQGYAHPLINETSGLCLHIMQIRAAYLIDPAAARAASKTKEVATAQLRTSMALQHGGAPSIPIVTVRDAHGGSFELHEVGPGLAGELRGREMFAKADGLADKGDHQGAITAFRLLLDRYPDHTVALNNLTSSYDALGDFNSALQAITQAIEIEPNFALYRGNQIFIALNCPRRRFGLTLFHQFRDRYPLVHDFDRYGIDAHLICGEPENALEILRNSPLETAQPGPLTASVETAVQARQNAATSIAEVRKSIAAKRTADREAVSRLEQAHAIFGADPVLKANLGFALRATGQYQRAVELLISAGGTIPDKWVMFCYASAAFCLIEMSDWPRAMALLRFTMQCLNGQGKETHPLDAPGVAVWIDEPDSVIETLAPSAADLIDRAIAECPDKNLLVPEVLQLAALYREARRLSNPQAPGPVLGP